MKKRFFACILLLLFCLSACSTESGISAHNDFCMMTEIRTRRVEKDEPFEIKVTFGQNFVRDIYNEAIFEIIAPKLEILFQDGTRAEERYERKISDFNHYGANGHTENIRFVYTGTEDEYYGSFCFTIRKTGIDEIDETPGGTSDMLYYVVSEELITVTFKRPKEYKSGSLSIVEVEKI